MMVIFLTGIVSLILMRTLRKDYAKYARETGDLDDLDQELDESGWKQVHGDVFRSPPQLTLFCALVGTGSQLASMVAIMIIFATATTLYMGRGGIIISFLTVYCLTSVVAGYTSGALYSRKGGGQWIRAMIYTAALFPAVTFATALILNVVGLMYGSLATVPFFSVLSVVLMWLLVSLPLCVVGTILGRNWSGTPNDPCRVNAIPRLIPEKRWYARPPVLVALGGVLPFGSIFIEMYAAPPAAPPVAGCSPSPRLIPRVATRRRYFVFTSFWNYKFYYVYGFMFLVFVILTIVTVRQPAPRTRRRKGSAATTPPSPAPRTRRRKGSAVTTPPSPAPRTRHRKGSAVTTPPSPAPRIAPPPTPPVARCPQVCVTIVVTYFLLNNEDYRWPWVSFAASSSTAGYVLLYSVYYFFMKTKMSGFFQTLFYFAYMFIFCLALGIMCGTLGYTGCSLFVRRIYRNIKSD